MENKDDQFQYWLMDMHDAINRFKDGAEPVCLESLDMSHASLLRLEEMLLARYSSPAAARSNENAAYIDGAARYLGETLRKRLGGKWFIDNVDKKNVFFGLPQLKGLAGQRTQLCPLTLVTATLDRRKGDYLFTIMNSLIESEHYSKRGL
ncbi:hypothetical protein [Luteibacter sp.]|uniref:hypothetical protein n=1 Tax=Luteibacter sp. TaxID=1886636 RepID=UPI003F7E3EAB